MMTLGGSALQVIVPAVCAWAFLFRQDEDYTGLMETYRVPAGAGIGHVHLKLSEEWPRDAESNIALAVADPLDLDALLREVAP